MNLHQSIIEEINQQQLNDVEKFADRLFAKIGIDVSFTRHFIERMNDQRNGKEVSAAELVRVFKKEYEKYNKDMKTLDDNAEAVFIDLSSDLNLPFVIKDRRDGKELVAKTIMRKPEFKTNDPTYKVQ